jgi:hypothetical protein
MRGMTLTRRVGVEPRRGPNGDYFVRLDPAVVNRLAVMRGLGESARDVIRKLGERPLGGPRLWRAFN